MKADKKAVHAVMANAKNIGIHDALIAKDIAYISVRKQERVARKKRGLQTIGYDENIKKFKNVANKMVADKKTIEDKINFLMNVDKVKDIAEVFGRTPEEVARDLLGVQKKKEKQCEQDPQPEYIQE